MPTDLSPAELWLTVAALILGEAMVGLMAWLEHRPRQTLAPRLVPTTLLLFAGTGLALLALVHLVNLMGIHTGR